MVRTHRVSKVACMACLAGAPWLGQAAANHIEQPAPQSVFRLTTSETASRVRRKEPIASVVSDVAVPVTLHADRGWGRGHRGRNGGARTAIIVGSIAAIAGGALLVYANRPERSAYHLASGCSYYARVAAGVVPAGRLLGGTVGALTWRQRQRDEGTEAFDRTTSVLRSAERRRGGRRSA